MRLRLDDCSPALKKRIEDAIRAETNGHRASLPPSYVEQDTCHAPLGAQEVTRLNPPVGVHVHSIRKRLADADGCSAKAVIDGIVRAGVIPDDDPANVKEVTFSQEKGEPERTIITIKEVGT